MEAEKRITFKEACEDISKYWKESKNIDIPASDIFNYSPSGELAMIFFWYSVAKEYYDNRYNPSTPD